MEKLPVPAKVLQKGTNVLAVEIHAVPYPAAFQKAVPEWSTCGLVELHLQGEYAEGLVPNVVRPAGVYAEHLDGRTGFRLILGGTRTNRSSRSPWPVPATACARHGSSSAATGRSRTCVPGSTACGAPCVCHARGNRGEGVVRQVRRLAGVALGRHERRRRHAVGPARPSAR